MEKPEDYTPEEREFLTRFRKRPGLYMGTDGVLSGFRYFYDGWETGIGMQEYQVRKLVPDGFQDFVAMRYLGKTWTPYGWNNLILQSEPDERKAFQIFWELLNEYLVSIGYEPIPEDQAEVKPFAHQDGIGRVYYTDLPVLAESYMRTFNGAPWFDRWDRKTALLRLRDLYKTPGFYGLSLWEDGMPLGTVLGRTERYFDGECFQIVEFWVEPRVQGQGYGMQLMDDLKGVMRSFNVKKLYLITMHGEQTERFYEKNGFVVQDGLCVMQLPEL